MSAAVQERPAEAMERLLMTMDVVDELRHRAAELQSYAGTEGQVEKTVARLKGVYRAQGIEVADDLLEAGVLAHRDKRFVYTAPTGLRVWLAMAWIRRGLISIVGFGTAGVIAACASLYVGLVVMPREARIDQHLAALSDDIERIPAVVEELDSALLAASSALYALGDSVNDAPHGARIADTASRIEEVARLRAEEARDTLRVIPADLPRDVEREEYETRYQRARGIVDTKLQSLESVRAGVIDVREQRVAMSDLLGANAALEEARTRAAVIPASARDPVYEKGASALAAGNLAAGQAAIAELNALVESESRLAAAGDRLERLFEAAYALPLDEAARAEVDRLRANADTALSARDLGRSEGAASDLEAMTRYLDMDLTYRVVNRPGQRSGVWRYPNDNRSTRNYYLIVSAVDGPGRVVDMPVRNEENGRIADVSEFGIRVPKSVYDRVGADKKADGIVDQAQVAAKARGALHPSFSIDVAGGYITQW